MSIKSPNHTKKLVVKMCSSTEGVKLSSTASPHNRMIMKALMKQISKAVGRMHMLSEEGDVRYCLWRFTVIGIDEAMANSNGMMKLYSLTLLCFTSTISKRLYPNLIEFLKVFLRF